VVGIPEANTGGGWPDPCRRGIGAIVPGEHDAPREVRRDFRNLRNSPTISTQIEPSADPREPNVTDDGHNDAVDDGHNTAVDLGRLAWLGTVLVCLIVVLILVLQGYYGYAGVTFAVALAAGINLF
jgi:hypothetical protein